MDTIDNLRYWTSRKRALELGIASDLDKGLAPRQETVDALQGVTGLVEELVLETPLSTRA